MNKLLLGIAVGWLMFDELGKKMSNKAGKMIKEKSDSVTQFVSKNIDTDKLIDYAKKQFSPKGLAENAVTDVATEAIAGVIEEAATLSAADAVATGAAIADYEITPAILMLLTINFLL